MTDRFTGARTSLLQRLLRPLLRVALLAVGALLMLGALLLGLVLAGAVLLWALLRGRRPGPVHLRWAATMPRPPGFGRPSGDIVDVQAREVDGPTLR